MKRTGDFEKKVAAFGKIKLGKCNFGADIFKGCIPIKQTEAYCVRRKQLILKAPMSWFTHKSKIICNIFYTLTRIYMKSKNVSLNT